MLASKTLLCSLILQIIAWPAYITYSQLNNECFYILYMASKVIITQATSLGLLSNWCLIAIGSDGERQCKQYRV